MMQEQFKTRNREIIATALTLLALVSSAAFAQPFKEGERFLLRKSVTMADGRVKVGALDVQPGNDGGEALVKTFLLEGGNFKEQLITLSELAKRPSPVKGFHFGVSSNDELLLVDKDTTSGPEVGVLQNAQGKHDVPSDGLKEWLAGDITIIKGTRMDDGRIRIGEKLSSRPVPVAPASSSNESVLTTADGIDLALVQAAKQKATKLKASLTPMFVDAKGKTRTWPSSSHSAYFMQDDIVYNVCSKPATLDDVKLVKGEVAQLRKPDDGGPLAWVKLPWRVTTDTAIWVSLVGNYGRKAETDVRVYVLSAAEFADYWKKRENKETPKLDSRGTSPVLVQDLAPGRYVVGVEFTMDSKVMEPMLGGLNPLDHVKDDVADQFDVRAGYSEDNGALVGFNLLRWYAYGIEVKNEEVLPVVSLLIPKGATISDCQRLYPVDKQFRIAVSAEVMGKLWQSLEEMGAKTTTQERERLLDLLSKGGRVCVPNTEWPTVLFLDSAGVPRMASRTPTSSETE